jgi:hypothetical protein
MMDISEDWKGFCRKVLGGAHVRPKTLWSSSAIPSGPPAVGDFSVHPAFRIDPAYPRQIDRAQCIDNEMWGHLLSDHRFRIPVRMLRLSSQDRDLIAVFDPGFSRFVLMDQLGPWIAENLRGEWAVFDSALRFELESDAVAVSMMLNMPR